MLELYLESKHIKQFNSVTCDSIQKEYILLTFLCCGLYHIAAPLLFSVS